MPQARNILAVDVGNSRVAMGCVAEETVARSLRMDAGDVPAGAGDGLAELWGHLDAPGPIVACAVRADLLEAVAAAARQRLGRELLVVGRDLPLPIETDLAEPQRIGADRLCAAAMAYHRLGQACVVADFGTAVTIDCVDGRGVFLGGAILPGLRMGAEALARGTAALPKVAPVRPDWLFGKDTRQAIVGGLVYGLRGALRQLTEDYATFLGRWPMLIVTGGDGPLIADGCEFVDAVVPDLTLLGIALAYRRAPRTS